MNMKSLCIIHCMFIMFSLGNADKWMQFQRVISFDGEVCQGIEVAFHKESLKDKSMCLFECTRYLSCKSIFYAEHTGSCTGCTTVYNVNSNPGGTASGSIYYEHAGCLEGWFSIQNSCYFITGDMSFEDGMNKCQTLNAHPVVIETEEENISLKGKLRLIESASTEPVIGFFTAYSDAETEDTWTVIGTSVPLSIDDWGQDEPNSSTEENCLAYYESKDFKWVDISCNTSLKMICEKETMD